MLEAIVAWYYRHYLLLVFFTQMIPCWNERLLQHMDQFTGNGRETPRKVVAAPPANDR